MDLNTGLTEALSDGTNTYLYGLDRIAQVNTATEYFLGDALGSVRQLMNASGVITYASAYDPYGVTTQADGASQTVYGFTNEYTSQGLVYLRARMYSPNDGRFLTKDPSGAETNLYQYASADPINRIDPTGLLSISDLRGPALFAMCFDFHSLTNGTVYINGVLVVVTAQLAVDICRAAYSMDRWNPDASSPLGFNFSGSHPTTGHDLFGWYLFEKGKSHMEFNADQPLTQELAKSLIVDKYVRYPYYLLGQDMPITKNGRVPLLEFDYLQQAECIDIGYMTANMSFPITCALGSFYYQVKTLPGGYIGIRIDNRTDLESGTHIAGRHRSEGYLGSVEDLIKHGAVSPHEPLSTVIWRKDVISILNPLDRTDTGAWTEHFFSSTLGGGNFEQTYVWREKLDPCPSLDKYLDGMVGTSMYIEPWSDYSNDTSSIDWSK